VSNCGDKNIFPLLNKLYNGSHGKLLRKRFDIFTAVRKEPVVSWVVTSCSVVVGYQHFSGQCSKTLASKHHTTWRNNPGKPQILFRKSSRTFQVK